MNRKAEDDLDELKARATGFLAALAAALSAYSAGEPDQDPAVGWASRETLAEHWAREVRTDLEAVGANFLSPETYQLLAMVESAQTVRACPAPDFEPPEQTAEILGEALTAQGMLDRLIPIGAQFYPHWWEVLDKLWDDNTAEAGYPPSPRPEDWPQIPPAPAHAASSSPGVAKQWVDAALELFDAVTSIYVDIDPARNGLDAEQRGHIRVLLRTIAVLDRKVDLLYEQFSANDWNSLMVVISELRALSRDLVLALSDDPERRALVMSPGDVKVRMEVFNRRAAGEPPEQAWPNAINDLIRRRDAGRR